MIVSGNATVSHISAVEYATGAATLVDGSGLLLNSGRSPNSEILWTYTRERKLFTSDPIGTNKIQISASGVFVSPTSPQVLFSRDSSFACFVDNSGSSFSGVYCGPPRGPGPAFRISSAVQSDLIASRLAIANDDNRTIAFHFLAANNTQYICVGRVDSMASARCVHQYESTASPSLFTISPNGNFVGMILNSTVITVNTGDGSVTRITNSSLQGLSGLLFSSDSSRLVFVGLEQGGSPPVAQSIYASVPGVADSFVRVSENVGNVSPGLRLSGTMLIMIYDGVNDTNPSLWSVNVSQPQRPTRLSPPILSGNLLLSPLGGGVKVVSRWCTLEHFDLLMFRKRL